MFGETDYEPGTEPRTCAAIEFHGSRNPDSPRFGPDEYCENEALPGSEYCAKHGAYDDDEGPW